MKIDFVSGKNIKNLESSNLNLSAGINLIYFTKESFKNLKNFLFFSVGENFEILAQDENTPIVTSFNFSESEKKYRLVSAKFKDKFGRKIESLDGTEKYNESEITNFTERNFGIKTFSEILITKDKIENFFESFNLKKFFVSNDPIEILLAEKVELDFDGTKKGKLQIAKTKILEIEGDLKNQNEIFSKIAKLEVELNQIQKEISEKEEKIKEFKYVAKNDEEHAKLKSEKEILIKKLDGLYEKLGPSLSEIKRKLNEKRRRVEDLKYFKDNAPKTIIPKIQDLMRDEETVEETFERQKLIFTEKEKELEKRILEADKISSILGNEDFEKVRLTISEILEIERNIKNLKQNLEILFKNRKKISQSMVFLGIISGAILIAIGLFTHFSLIILGLIVSGIFAVFGQDKSVKTINELEEKIKNAETLKIAKESERDKYFALIGVANQKEFDDLIGSSEGIDIEIKTKSMEVENMKSDIENKLKPKLEKFLTEKEKYLKETGYATLKEIKERAEEYKNLKNDIDDLEFDMMRSGKDDKNKETEKEIDEIELKIKKLDEEIEKLGKIDANAIGTNFAEKGILELEPQILELTKKKEVLEKELGTLKEKDVKVLTKNLNKLKLDVKKYEKDAKILQKTLDGFLKVSGKNLNDFDLTKFSIEEENEEFAKLASVAQEIGVLVSDFESLKSLSETEKLSLFLSYKQNSLPILFDLDEHYKGSIEVLLKALQKKSSQIVMITKNEDFVFDMEDNEDLKMEIFRV
ncbi:MAG: hypothetical protein Fur0024_1620 [Patescibacteria group bacterium]